VKRFLRCGSLIVVAALVASACGDGGGAADSAADEMDAASTTTLDEAALIESLAAPIVYSDFASRAIYFVMTDRYANGDPSNDLGGTVGPRSVTGYDPTDIGFFHGGDLRGLTGGCTDPKNGVQRLADLGFSGIWITPLVVQRTVQGDSAAYHGYWGVDFTTVDPRFGTES
jgi:hypothetical protein